MENIYVIKYNGGEVEVVANSITDALQKYKELKMQGCNKEISIVKKEI